MSNYPPTTETNAPDAAVQIARRVIAEWDGNQHAAPDVVAALARAGWLHDPAEIERLTAVASAAAEVDELLDAREQIWQNAEAAERLGQALIDLRE